MNTREVIPEYGLGTGKVDYCLKVGKANAVFIEVKRASENLKPHQEQLLRYAFMEGVGLAILTNGLIWWFYLPLAARTWEQRKFLTIDIKGQESKTINGYFYKFLSKDAIAAGKSQRAALSLHLSRTRQKAIEDALPEAWHLLIEEQSEGIVDLLSEKLDVFNKR